MTTIYRYLLRFYPDRHRREFEREMMGVLQELHAGTSEQSLATKFSMHMREVSGLLLGGFCERWREFSMRRFTMHTEFRFPKITWVLMTLILGGVLLAIEKGEALQASLPSVNPPIGPIHAGQHTLISGMALLLAFVYGLGALAWVVLFAFRRAGVHRLDHVSEHE